MKRRPHGGRAVAAGLAALAIAVSGTTPRPVAATEDADGAAQVQRIVTALANDAMRGRGAGTPELERARDLVQAELAAVGLEAGFADGWLQGFEDPRGIELANVAGRVAGSGDEWLVVGAHYDGLGVGALGTEFAGRIQPGADDNASGVAALVRIAQTLAREKDLRRSVWIVAFSGEELGTLGSEHFVAHPPADLSKCVAMLNLDTVGRIENDRVIVFGAGTAEQFEDILRGVNLPFGFDLRWNEGGVGASDHTPFFAKGIPVLHFFSGAKPEYHRPGDRLELVDFAQTAKLADFVAETVVYLATSDEPLTFRPVGIENLAATASRGPRHVSFGSIPDFSRETGGILLSGVMPGSPAESAGLAAGDLVVEMDGQTIDTIQDFQGVLAEHEPGDVVSVRYVRAGETKQATVTLAERR